MQILWTHGRVVTRGKQRVRVYPVICPECGHRRDLRACDARRAAERGSVCRRCHTSAAGRKGYAATVARYGADFFLQVTAATQKRSPSKPELQVAAMLEDMGVEFETQVILPGKGRNFVVDFYLPDSGTVLEINGYWHREYRQDRDALLVKAWDVGHVEFIDADLVILDPGLVRERLQTLAQ